MDWMTTLKQLAPTVASAILGPLGGIAVAAIGSVLGVSDATQDKIAEVIKNGQLTPEQIGEIKKLEMQYQENERERGFKYAELEFKDRDSARAREVGTKDNTNKILAFVVIGAFLAMVGATLLGYAKVESVLAGTLVGYLSAKAEQVLAYYFGSSSGSKAKTDLLANSTPTK
jgi:hypothetical protein